MRPLCDEPVESSEGEQGIAREQLTDATVKKLGIM
jgi:hypothetical protein